jgi:4-amino-4-deoxy-L-arabinose transferase-like glycosyltransferase
VNSTISRPFPARAYFWVFAVLAALVTLAPIRRGDLAGYDDARYALVAKEMIRSGDWLDLRYNDCPVLEHPPMLIWVQAAFFKAFGFHDPIAKLPSALCGFGTIVLVFWLARRLTGDPLLSILAMFVMATSIYFIKYAARAMTDVPFTFFCLCAVCSWVLAEEKPKWYVAAGLFTAMAMLTRALMGVALPMMFAGHLLVARRKLSLGYLGAGLLLAFLPPIAWYAHWLVRYGDYFFQAQSRFFDQEVYGGLTPAWRKYTGAFEYVWMISKSYWPWLPFMLVGLIWAIRSRARRLSVLIPWVATVFFLCSLDSSRVLRYMLPAYPAFAILAAVGLIGVVPQRYLITGLRWVTPALAILVLKVAIWPPVNWHAADTHSMALAGTAASEPGETIALYDQGVPRYDEVNELLWYGDRTVLLLRAEPELSAAMKAPRARVFVVDVDTYRNTIAARIPHQLIRQSGHLVCLRLSSS